MGSSISLKNLTWILISVLLLFITSCSKDEDAIDKSAALSAAGILPASSDIGQSGSVEYVTKSPVTFTGLGYGHGIGMPQDSAIEMAKQGFTYDEILHYYYTDIEIK